MESGTYKLGSKKPIIQVVNINTLDGPDCEEKDNALRLFRYMKKIKDRIEFWTGEMTWGDCTINQYTYMILDFKITAHFLNIFKDSKMTDFIGYSVWETFNKKVKFYKKLKQIINDDCIIGRNIDMCIKKEAQISIITNKIKFLKRKNGSISDRINRLDAGLKNIDGESHPTCKFVPFNADMLVRRKDKIYGGVTFSRERGEKKIVYHLIDPLEIKSYQSEIDVYLFNITPTCTQKLRNMWVREVVNKIISQDCDIAEEMKNVQDAIPDSNNLVEWYINKYFPEISNRWCFYDDNKEYWSKIHEIYERLHVSKE